MPKNHDQKPFEIPRPEFPKRAVVTGGMPYGNKELHFGHVGGMLVFADTYARFLRDRIGSENVIFVSGTDCYGSPIAEGWRKKVEAGEFEGSLEDFVRRNHEKQKDTLKSYGISPNLFGASAQALFDAPAFGLLRQYGALLAASAVLACPFALTLRKKLTEQHPVLLALAAAVLFFLCTAFLATDNYNPFLYFRF